MELTKLDADLDVIQKLDDEPNDVGGMSAEELKKKFDEAPNVIKKYINEQLLPGIAQLLESLDEAKAGRDELQGVVLNQIPDGTVTTAKLNTGAVTKEKLASEVQQEIGSHVKEEHYAAGTLPVSERLAESAGLPAPAFAEGVMAVLSDKVNGLMNSVEGKQTGNVWKMHRWSTFAQSKSLTFYATGDWPNYSIRIRAASSLSIGRDGAVALATPTDMGNVTQLPAVGTYIQFEQYGGWEQTVYRVLDGSTMRFNSASDVYGNTWAEAKVDSIGEVVSYAEYLGTVTAENADTYPEDGWVGDIYYVKETALGAKIAQVETSHRAGTGRAGADAPTELRFAFSPRVVMVFGPGAVYAPWILNADALGSDYISVGGSRMAKRSEDGRTVYVYASSALDQFNEVSRTYHIVGIG